MAVVKHCKFTNLNTIKHAKKGRCCANVVQIRCQKNQVPDFQTLDFSKSRDYCPTLT